MDCSRVDLCLSLPRSALYTGTAAPRELVRRSSSRWLRSSDLPLAASMQPVQAAGEPDDTPDGCLSALIHLKCSNKAFLVSLVVLFFLFGLWHWEALLIALLVVLLPSSRLIFWWKRNMHVAPLDHILASYAQGFWVLVIVGTFSGLIAAHIAIIPLYIIMATLFGAGL